MVANANCGTPPLFRFSRWPRSLGKAGHRPIPGRCPPVPKPYARRRNVFITRKATRATTLSGSYHLQPRPGYHRRRCYWSQQRSPPPWTGIPCTLGLRSGTEGAAGEIKSGQRTIEPNQEEFFKLIGRIELRPIPINLSDYPGSAVGRMRALIEKIWRHSAPKHIVAAYDERI
jgi:hypothetical protein